MLALIFLVAEAALPNLVLVMMGRVTGKIPGAVLGGLGSAAGSALIVALVLAGAVYSLSLMRGPAEDALSAFARARVGMMLQRRLVAAVCAPTGIGHLEDPEVLNRLSSAQGELASYQPADAPMTLISLLGDRLSGVVACVVLMTFRWWLGLLLLAVWLFTRGPLRVLVRARMRMFREASEPLRRSWYLLGLVLRPAAAKEVRVFGLGDWIVGEHRREWLAGMTPGWDVLRRLNRHVTATALLVLAAYGLALWVLGSAAYHHRIGLRTLATMLPMLPMSMQAGIISLSDFQLESMLTALPDLDSLVAELRPPEADALTGRRPAAGLPARRVQFERVSFRYPRAQADVLDGLDLTLFAGQSLAIVGVNGAGKSTLVSLLARLHDPTGGHITVDGHDLVELDARAWQRQVAVVYQDFTRYPLPAEENVALNLLGQELDRGALEQAVERAGAAPVIAQHGWDTVLSPQYSGGADLSGGQWQRVALARALYAVSQGARVLVLDEPTAQLDVRGEAAFYERFLELTAGVTSVVISHRFSTVRRAQRIAVLDGGRITELGTHEQLLEQGGTYATMFELQAAQFAAQEAA